MRGWLMQWFHRAGPEPLDRPPPLEAGRSGDPIPEHVRDIQHDADNVRTSVRGTHDLLARRVRDALRDAP